MDNKIVCLLLQLIKNQENLNSLLRNGLEYYQIVEYLNFALMKKYVIMEKGNVQVTETGMKKIMEEYSILNKGWIKPLDYKRIKKISKFDIYLP